MPDRVFCDQHDPKHCAKWVNESRPLFDDICPYCEIDILKGELEEAKLALQVERQKWHSFPEDMMNAQIKALQAELAEARAAKEELEENYLEIGCLSDSQEIKELKDKTRQEAARVCLELSRRQAPP